MSRRSENQLNINTQFNGDLAGLKTQQLFVIQALGATVELLDGLLERLVQRRALAADDPLIGEFQRAMAIVRKFLRLDPPDDPDAPAPQVKCPGCQAVIKVSHGRRVERCDWCGHLFGDS
jgi:hypothetical protein